MARIIGIIMLSALLVGVFAMIVWIDGIKTALTLAGITVALTVWVLVAVYLMEM